MKFTFLSDLYKKSRLNIFSRWGVDLLLIWLIFFSITSWQTKDLISEKEQAPSFILTSLSGKAYSLIDQKTILYFFSPSCTICHLSIGNLETLKRDDITIYAIALSYRSHEEVEQFVKEKELTIPILLGNSEIMRQYKISAFPTYYILDEHQKIESYDIGYTTELGMKLRML